MREPRMLRALSQDITESTEHADMMLPNESHDRIENAEPAEPIDPMDPTEPIDRMDPVEPIDRIDPLEPIDSREFRDRWADMTPSSLTR